MCEATDKSIYMVTDERANYTSFTFVRSQSPDSAIETVESNVGGTGSLAVVGGDDPVTVDRIPDLIDDYHAEHYTVY